jgi:hypothetical protein
MIECLRSLLSDFFLRVHHDLLFNTNDSIDSNDSSDSVRPSLTYLQNEGFSWLD